MHDHEVVRLPPVSAARFRACRAKSGQKSFAVRESFLTCKTFSASLHIPVLICLLLLRYQAWYEQLTASYYNGNGYLKK